MTLDSRLSSYPETSTFSYTGSRDKGDQLLFAFIRNIGGPELLIILLIVVLFFGASRLPSLAKSLGQSARELKKGLEEGAEDEETVEESDVS